jgi:hypothetical protein
LKDARRVVPKELLRVANWGGKRAGSMAGCLVVAKAGHWAAQKELRKAV